MNIFEIKGPEPVPQEPSDGCKGLFWRASESQYLSSHKSIEAKRSLRFLKRMSCPGCERCDWIWEHIREDTIETDNLLDHLIAGQIYEFYVSGSHDYESGYYEIDESGFRRVKDETTCN